MNKYFAPLLLLLILDTSFKSSYAQWVHIPDAKFRTVISEIIPSAINGDSLDTTNAEVVNLTNLNLSSRNISDLTGIVHFQNLKYLYCYSNNLSQLPALPNTLIYLDCNDNSIYSLPNFACPLEYFDCSRNAISGLLGDNVLPPTLKRAYLSHNFITDLPAYLPSLEIFDCSSNLIKGLPFSLPNSLLVLNFLDNKINAWPPFTTQLPSNLIDLKCGGNPLKYLPPLPSKLSILYCAANQLDSLPALPASLTELECSGNNLASLPPLPSGLKVLRCEINSLDSLPQLPATELLLLWCDGNKLHNLPTLSQNLKDLNCASNQLSSLPSLPTTLTSVSCNSNQLTSLPILPKSLITLNCRYNNISCLPILPDGLQNLYGDAGGYNCIPNYPPALKYIWGPTNICVDTSNCFPYPRITGIIFRDDNLNGVRDFNEIGRSGSTVMIEPGSYFFPTTDSTYYSHIVDTGSAYTITPQSILYYNWVPVSHTTPVIHSFETDSLNDFALQRIGIIHDIKTSITGVSIPRPGFNTKHIITIENKGTVDDTASLKYSHSPYLFYVSANPKPDTLINDSIFWEKISLKSGERKSFEITFNVNNLVPLGTDLISNVIAEPLVRDTTPSDNISLLHQTVVGSFDPNDKTVIPSERIELSEILKGQLMDYTIRFQNCGNAPALQIKIIDTLDSKLEIPTFQMVSSSHNVKWEIKNHILEFLFDDINLPDSVSNETESHGFVRYETMVKTNLSVGDTISNTASIYFDSNPAIKTNTTYTYVFLSNNIAKSSNNSELSLYPNPAQKSVRIGSQQLLEKIQLYDIEGHKLLEKNVNAFNTELDVINLAKGVYIVTSLSNNMIQYKKLIKY